MEHKAFKHIFTREWIVENRRKLEKFLSRALNMEIHQAKVEAPRSILGKLYSLYKTNKDKESQEEIIFSK